MFSPRNRRKLVLVLCYFTLLMSTGQFALARDICGEEFREIAGGLAKKFTRRSGETLAIETKATVGEMQGRFRSLVKRDIKSGTLEDMKVYGPKNLVDVGEDAVAAAQRMIEAMRDDLENQGFKVKIATRQADAFENGPNLLRIPERPVLIIESGTATGPIAREIRHAENFIAKRLRDPKLPESVRASPMSITYDPVGADAFASDGFFAELANGESGIALASSVFMGKQSFASEVIRHELRHAKNFFDLNSKRNTDFRIMFRGTPEVVLGDTSVLNLNSVTRGAKAHLDPEEMYAYLANVRAQQVAIGKITAQARQRAKEHKLDLDLHRAYKRDVQKFSEIGLARAKLVSDHARLTLENIERVRSRISQISRDDLAVRVSSTKSSTSPGLRQIIFDLSNEVGSGQDVLVTYMPRGVADQGLNARIEHLQSYLNQLETTTKAVQKNLEARVKDLERDAIERLELNAPPQ